MAAPSLTFRLVRKEGDVPRQPPCSVGPTTVKGGAQVAGAVKFALQGWVTVVSANAVVPDYPGGDGR
jgi:hypothetical protein